MSEDTLPQLTVLLSGRGSNMQAIHRACSNGLLNATIAHVISNESNAEGLSYARCNNIKASVLEHRHYANRIEFDLALLDLIEQDSPDLILLAGFMRRLSGEFTNRFESRLINIHPSLLPRHPGLHTHKKAIDNGDEWHGCSIHYVTEELDGGPVIAQSRVRIDKTDGVDSLSARVLRKEHELYWQVVKLCLAGKVECQNGHIFFCGKRLQYPILM